MLHIRKCLLFVLCIAGCSEGFNKSDSDKNLKLNFVLDGDLIIDGTKHLNEFIPPNPTYLSVEINARALRLKRNSILFTNGMYVTFTVETFESDGGIIQTFSQGELKAQSGENGRSGGAIVISGANASGEIDFYLFGQDGGDGIKPKDLGVESNGRDGRNGKDGYMWIEEASCINDYGLVEGGEYCILGNTYCFLQPTSGENGEDGKDGLRGGDAGNGGDSGSVKLNISGSNSLIAKYEIRGGSGGKGSSGGLGSSGGRGGIKGALKWEYRPEFGYSAGHCTAYEDGKPGKNGVQGPKGLDGAPGKQEDFCLKNFETGDYQCGF